MEKLHPEPAEDLQAKKRKLAAELVAAAKNGEITSLHNISPKDTSIEVVQQIKGILRSQGILPKMPTPSNSHDYRV